MCKDLAESFAAGIERNEIRECTERLHRYRVRAATAQGQEREQFLMKVEAAEVELIQWRDLASLVRTSPDDLVREPHAGLGMTAIQQAMVS